MRTNSIGTTPVQPTARPRQVKLAVCLLWLAVLLGGAYVYVLIDQIPAAASVGAVVCNQVTLLAVVAIGITFVASGRNWARIAMLAYTALSVLGLAFVPNLSTRALDYGLQVVGTLLYVVAMYLVFLTPGRLWFRRSHEART